MSIIQVPVQIPAGTCMYPGRCRYLPQMRVPVARMMGMDFWPWVPVLADADVSGYAIVKISNTSTLPAMTITATATIDRVY